MPAASAAGVRRAPSARTFASLCCRDSRAASTSETTAARTPATLLAAIDMPMPLPQTRIPRSQRPFATASATALARSG